MHHQHTENPFQELRLFINELEQFVEEMAKDCGAEHLGGPQGHAILFLKSQEHQDISFKDMEEALHLSKSVNSNLMKRMEKNGFIEIVPSKEDKRVKYVVLTEFGRKKAENIDQFRSQMKVILAKGLTKEDFHILHKVFIQLKSNLHEEVERQAQKKEN
ncbi:MarR family transcriptional regulator [Streptococcus sp. X16XC17]|uniref:MarR family winged helix-turn-helix transcriptional regulator n=1 Tax=unclassified Streptococcus TaxID=2608887 RepID=UPI00066FD7B9|nr:MULTISPECIES: MarR family transcriptional regulator [unclassified Streptococcus]TCD46084.1 MarR family transcriptional regulator [Streptococcus sp. X16XC17]